MGSVNLNSEYFERAANRLSSSMDSFNKDGNFDESVRKFEQTVQMMKEQVDRMAKIAGMVAENQQDENNVYSPTYGEKDYKDI